MKCVAYENSTNDLDHWIDEISTYLDIVNSLELKTKTGKLKKDDYLRNVFYAEAETKKDVEVNLKLFKLDKNYPDFEINSNLISKIFDVFNEIAENSSEIFCDKNNTFEKEDFKNLIKDSLEQVGIY